MGIGRTAIRKLNLCAAFPNLMEEVSSELKNIRIHFLEEYQYIRDIIEYQKIQLNVLPSGAEATFEIMDDLVKMLGLESQIEQTEDSNQETENLRLQRAREEYRKLIDPNAKDEDIIVCGTL